MLATFVRLAIVLAICGTVSYVAWIIADAARRD